MAQQRKKFVFEVEYSDEDMYFMAEANGLSIEQLTDEKIAEFLLHDMQQDEFPVISVMPDLTKPTA